MFFAPWILTLLVVASEVLAWRERHQHREIAARLEQLEMAEGVAELTRKPADEREEEGEEEV